MKELARLQARITELEKFVSACRYAGPYGVKKLREEAKRLFSKRKSVE